MYKWNEMTREEVKHMADQDCVVVVTIGAIEQHGPHLPLMVDNMIVETIAEISVAKADKSIPVILGPNIPFGFSHHHYQYAGAISLSIHTLMIVLKEVLESLIKSNIKKILVLNSHGGNDEIIKLAAKEVHYEHDDIWISAASYWNLAGTSLSKYKKEVSLYDVGHAGQFETSLMLAIDPSLVHLDKLEQGAKERETSELIFSPVVQMKSESIWDKMDGYSDEPWKAKKEIGQTLIDIISDSVNDALQSFYKE